MGRSAIGIRAKGGPVVHFRIVEIVGVLQKVCQVVVCHCVVRVRSENLAIQLLGLRFPAGSCQQPRQVEKRLDVARRDLERGPV